MLQVKEAQASVLEPYAGPSTLGHHGRRVVEGQLLTQAASDIFLGWTDGAAHRPPLLRAPALGLQGILGSDDDGREQPHVLRRVVRDDARPRDVRSGDPVPIVGYLGSGKAFDRAIAAWAAKYARTNEEDHGALVDAIAAGRLAGA